VLPSQAEWYQPLEVAGLQLYERPLWHVSLVGAQPPLTLNVKTLITRLAPGS
jgi:hypothetical protein